VLEVSPNRGRALNASEGGGASFGKPHPLGDEPHREALADAAFRLGGKALPDEGLGRAVWLIALELSPLQTMPLARRAALRAVCHVGETYGTSSPSVDLRTLSFRAGIGRRSTLSTYLKDAAQPEGERWLRVEKRKGDQGRRYRMFLPHSTTAPVLQYLLNTHNESRRDINTDIQSYFFSYIGDLPILVPFSNTFRYTKFSASQVIGFSCAWMRRQA
jgi:hypothetical protein